MNDEKVNVDVQILMEEYQAKINELYQENIFLKVMLRQQEGNKEQEDSELSSE